MAYSRTLGDVARDLRAATVPVVDDLERLSKPPDLIHAQHHLEAITALAYFPGVPAIYMCHGWIPAEEAPPRHPQIVRYVAVDDLVRIRLTDECGLSETQISTQRNFVDLDRFPEPAPLPEKPRRALIFSNGAREDNFVPVVRQACKQAGLQLDVRGRESGQPVEKPGDILSNYEIVFAKARAALESAAAGAAVILCDVAGLGTLVTSDSLDTTRRLNFGVRLLRAPHTVEGVLAQLDRYDAADAREVTKRIRNEASLDLATERMLALYREVLEGSRVLDVPPLLESRAIAGYLRKGPLSSGDFFQPQRERLIATHAASVARIEGWAKHLQNALREEQGARQTREEALQGLERDNSELSEKLVDKERSLLSLKEELGALEEALENARARCSNAEARCSDLGEELNWMRQSATWRWRSRLLLIRPLAWLYRKLVL